MSTAMKVTPLKDVKPYKSRWKVHVKVLHSWKQYNPVHGDTLEMVLSDEDGVKAACFLLEHGGTSRISPSVLQLACTEQPIIRYQGEF